MEAKIKMKLGDVEFEYEGSSDFLQKGFSDLVSRMLALPLVGKTIGSVSRPHETLEVTQPNKQPSSDSPKWSMATWAAKMNVSTGPDLVVAAVAKLVIGDSLQGASKRDILKEMQAANSYWKKTYLSNYGRQIGDLVRKDKLRETASGVYTLSPKWEQEIRGIFC